MASPGWYPDPRGTGAPRYWDGAQWANVAPSTGSAGSGSGSGRRTLTSVGIGLVTILLVVAVLIWQPWNSTGLSAQGDNNSSKPTGSQWNELEPTENPSSPQPDDGQGRPQACPLIDAPEGEKQGRWYISGGIGFEGVRGWEDERGAWTIDFASERSGQLDSVKANWVSITAIGQLDTTDFSADARTAASQVSECLSSSYYYSTLERRERLQDEAFTTTDGVEGWIIRENYWNIPGQPVSGDEVVVVVLQSGTEDTLTLFHTQAPIEDQKRKDAVAAALESLSKR